MLRSMTGYGAASVESPTLRASVAVRSLNHRFLEIALQLPRGLRPLEAGIKEAVQRRVRRGRVEVQVQASLLGAVEYAVSASPGLVSALVRSLRELEAHHGLEGGVSVSDVARFPGAIQVEEPREQLAEERRQELLGVLARALDELEQMREREGSSLAEHLNASVDAVEAGAARIAALEKSGREARRETLLEKLRELAREVGLDESRLYQEAVRLVDRSDVAEELARLGSHLARARELIGDEAPSGRRLDFLAQELMREANTLGSKSLSVGVVREVVELKGEIERFREQVQNVE